MIKRFGKHSPNWKGGKSIAICKNCGKEFKFWKSNQPGIYCSKKCSHKNTLFKNGSKGHWKNGRTHNAAGYISIYNPTHPFARNGRYVFEHHLIMEEKIGRYLKKTERIHHINGIKDDNRQENLMLFASESDHQKYHQKLKH